eukprot:Platyproteum_vivax@DN2046_c0_g1_i1.p1
MAIKINYRGSPAADFCNWAVDPDPGGGMWVAEYVHLTKKEDSSRVAALYNIPPGVEELVWLYEHLRNFVVELNQLISIIGNECTCKTCPKMTASHEWQFLCAAHKKPQDCAAVDYMVHTLDGSAALLSNVKSFPVRGKVSSSCTKYFQPLSRRLYRIFAHVYFHHPGIFASWEEATNLCARFSYFVAHYDLLPVSAFLVPSSAYLAYLDEETTKCFADIYTYEKKKAEAQDAKKEKNDSLSVDGDCKETSTNGPKKASKGRKSSTIEMPLDDDGASDCTVRISPTIKLSSASKPSPSPS